LQRQQVFALQKIPFVSCLTKVWRQLLTPPNSDIGAYDSPSVTRERYLLSFRSERDNGCLVAGIGIEPKHADIASPQLINYRISFKTTSVGHDHDYLLHRSHLLSLFNVPILSHSPRVSAV
jgi:hypothetical protein